jgi:hypothetical protein
MTMPMMIDPPMLAPRSSPPLSSATRDTTRTSVATLTKIPDRTDLPRLAIRTTLRLAMMRSTESTTLSAGTDQPSLEQQIGRVPQSGTVS